jgi:hypothetical protein
MSSVNETIDLTNDQEAPISIPPRSEWVAVIKEENACETEKERLYQERTKHDNDIMVLDRVLRAGPSIVSHITATKNAWATHYELLFHKAATLTPVIANGWSAESFFIRIKSFLELYSKA